MKALLLLLAGGLIPCCSSPQSQATGALKRMKAENYFTQTIQIELAKAAEQGNVAAIDKAISMGADVNKVGKEEMTPLAWAIGKQNKAGFQRLLEKGANPNFRTGKMGPSKAETSVIELASIAEDSDYLRLVLKYGGNPNAIISTISQHTVLYSAIRNHRHENMKMLLKAGSNINHRDKTGATPIMAASNNTQFDMVFFLIQRGADLSIRQTFVSPDGKVHKGWTLAEQIKQGGDRSIRVLGKEREQREWYNKVVAELKRRGLM